MIRCWIIFFQIILVNAFVGFRSRQRRLSWRRGGIRNGSLYASIRRNSCSRLLSKRSWRSPAYVFLAWSCIDAAPSEFLLEDSGMFLHCLAKFCLRGPCTVPCETFEILLNSLLGFLARSCIHFPGRNTLWKICGKSFLVFLWELFMFRAATSRSRASRVAEVSRFKKYTATGFKN